jgi:hypothetical protein
MDKKIAGLLGAAAALTAVSSAQAAIPASKPQPASTYRDLLEPIPNALALVKDEDSKRIETPANGEMRLAQHHHHHHHRWYRRFYHHHHHHHHHQRYHHHY